jgi:hypothetical protein
MTRFTSRTVTEATTAASVGVNVGCACTLILDLAKYSDATEYILDSATLQSVSSDMKYDIVPAAIGLLSWVVP